jgi:RNA polymerase II-associated factor 1
VNSLPEVPVEAKFLTIPFDLERYVSYRYTSLERDTKSDIHYGVRETIPVPLVDLSIYPSIEEANLNVQSPERLHPADLALLSLGAGTELAPMDSKRDAVLSTVATDFTIRKRATGSFSLKQPASRFGHVSEVRKKEFSKTMTIDRAKQVIGQTFQDARPDTLLALTHPLKPELSVRKMLPILPDRKSWPDE